MGYFGGFATKEQSKLLQTGFDTRHVISTIGEISWLGMVQGISPIVEMTDAGSA